MGRWDISDPDRVHSGDQRQPAQEGRGNASTDSVSMGRGGSSESAADELSERHRTVADRASAGRDRRTQHVDRGRNYSLRSTEIAALADIGRFRTVDVRDLARFVYNGDQARMKNDLQNLRKQGLIEEKNVLRAHKTPRRMVTLTEPGARLVRKAGGLPLSQRIYHGFVKPREVEHDADLYKVYQKAIEKIAEKGGKAIRVRLDFELKESINRSKEAAGRLPEAMREGWLAAVAEEHGLSSDGRRIHLPDVQVEYQMPDGRIERENLELVSRNYREQGIRGKAAAGFSMYARSADSARIRRALRDTGLMREVLSV